MSETLFDEVGTFEALESNKKVGVNDEIRFSEYHDEPCTESDRKRQESA